MYNSFLKEIIVDVIGPTNLFPYKYDMGKYTIRQWHHIRPIDKNLKVYH